MQGFFVTGTDTDVGKTVVSAWLLSHLDACYWKPVQAGTEPETDSMTVRRLAEVPEDRILREAYILKEPLSPQEAAKREGIVIDMAKLEAPSCDRPIVLVARSTLGTINHTLLSLEALRRRGLFIAGVVMNGPETPHNRVAIERYGKTQVLAEIPWLEAVTKEALKAIEPEMDLAKLTRVDT